MIPVTPLQREKRIPSNGRTAFALIAMMACELLWLATDWAPFRFLAFAAMLSVVPLSAMRFGWREAYLLTLCIFLTITVFWQHETPITVIYTALEQAAFLMAFILLIALIQQAAMTSKAILECGTYLTGQRAGRRYFALFGGTHIMANLFNLGVISLLAPLIKRGTEESDPINAVREQRQINAMLRGFAWCVIWSPTALAPLVLSTLLPEAKRGYWITAGIVISFLVMIAGYIEDRWQWRHYPANAGRGPIFPIKAYCDFAIVCIVLLALTCSAMVLFDGSVVFGLMMASPIIMLGWLLMQNGGLTPKSWISAKQRISEIAFSHLPQAAPIAVTLACSGYVGRAGAALIPAAEWAETLNIQAWPPWLFLLSLSIGIAVLSQLALSPIMMAVFFGSLIAALPQVPADITWVALAISCGWGLSMTASPFATVILITAQATNHTGRELTWAWNGRFSLICVAILAVVFWVLAKN